MKVTNGIGGQFSITADTDDGTAYVRRLNLRRTGRHSHAERSTNVRLRP